MKNVLDKVRFSRIATNGIHLNVAEAGPKDGRLVILLHGFPEFWYGWRNQIAPFAEQGFHVVAPDQRGFNLSDKPTGIASYDLNELAADVIGLADYFGEETFALIGHDWGASVGWWLADQHAQRVRRLAVLNAPHPVLWLDAMRNNPAQKRKSSYVRFLQLAYLPELLIGLDRSKMLGTGFRSSIRQNAFTETDLKQYRTAWSQRGALTAMINYYRALLKKPSSATAGCKITCPTLVIWGKRDVYAVPELAEASVKLCTHGRIAYLNDSSHWVQHDEPDRVLSLLLEFLNE